MNIKLILKEINALQNLVKSLDEIGSVSVIDQAIIKRRLENLYEYIITDHYAGPFGAAERVDLSTDRIEKVEQVRAPEVRVSEQAIIPETPVSKEESVVQVSKEEPPVKEEVKKEPLFYFDPEPEAEIIKPIERTPEPRETVVERTVRDETQQGVVQPMDNGSRLQAPEIHEVDNSELDRIFEIRQGNELSERLSSTPIKDIFKAMGLNERIFTQNELFGGNNEVFRQTIDKLNNFSTFAEAKRYLKATVADTYAWSDSGRVKIAQNFVQLVHRRYKDKM